MFSLKEIRKKYPNTPYLLALLLCCLVAYWPLTFHVYSLKNDALNYFLPIRYQISDAISHGEWPFWSPYFNLGYPLHGDMQSGAWNPFVQIFSLFGVYTLSTLQNETLLYIFLSGVGMFYLLTHFKLDKRVCLLSAASYMLCGFISDSAQFLNWISGASFLPFVLLFFLRTLTEAGLRNSILTGFFLYLFFVTAYPADFILLAYAMFALVIWHCFIKKKESYRRQYFILFKKLLLIVAIFTFLSLPAILSYAQFLPLSERGTGADYKSAMSNPIHPILFFSYVVPLGGWKAPHVWITDPLERNSFFGIITFTIMLAGMVSKSGSRWVKFCKWGFIVSSIFSLGEFGGLRQICYYTLPLMDAFRHPANAKLFTIFFACILAAIFLHRKDSLDLRKRKIAFSVICIFLFLMTLWACIKGFHFFKQFNPLASGLTTSTLKTLLDQTSFSDLVVLNAFIQLPFVVLTYLWFVKRISIKGLLYAQLLNSIIHIVLFTPLTVVKKDKVAYVQDVIDQNLSSGFPQPDLNKSIMENSLDGEKYFKEIGTLNMYNKRIGRVDYRITPSNLNTQNEFWNKNFMLRNTLLKYPLLYKADTIVLERDTSIVKLRPGKKICIVKDQRLQKTTRYSGNEYDVKYQVTNFSPNLLDIRISSSEPGFYCLFQNYYPNWKLYVDGKETPIVESNISFMGFAMDKGLHIVKFRYEAPELKIAFFISVLTLSIMILSLFMKQEIKQP